MSDYLTKLLDELDACVFSGDLLYVNEERELLEHFLCRWFNAVADHKEMIELERLELIDPNSTALLAPCPFCGKAGETQTIDDPDSSFFPQCTGCGWCDVWFSGKDSESQWNHRANEQLSNVTTTKITKDLDIL